VRVEGGDQRISRLLDGLQVPGGDEAGGAGEGELLRAERRGISHADKISSHAWCPTHHAENEWAGESPTKIDLGCREGPPGLPSRRLTTPAFGRPGSQQALERIADLPTEAWTRFVSAA
jgi:hypothetical protein